MNRMDIEHTDTNRQKVAISVVIPCRNEEKYISACLDSVLASESVYSEKEIFVCDGLSTDSTRQIIDSYCLRYKNVHIVDNPYLTTPVALNLGIKASRSEFVAILGAHATVTTAYFDDVVKSFQQNPEADCIGGLIENVYLDEISASVGFAMSSPFGVGNSNFRTGVKGGWVDTVAFGVYRRDVFDKIGLFDEELSRNQDDEFSYRMLKHGMKIFLDLGIRSKYYVRSIWTSLFRQFYQYGFWKVFVNRRHRAVTTVRQLVPFFFVSALLAGVLLTFLSPVFPLCSAAAVVSWVIVAASFALPDAKSFSRFINILFSFWVLHFAYGLGYLFGVWFFLIFRRNPSSRHSRLTR